MHTLDNKNSVIVGWSLAIVYCIASIASSAWLIGVGYEGLVSKVLALLQRPELYNLVTQKYFTTAQYSFLLIAYPILLTLGFMVLYMAWCKRKKSIELLLGLCDYIRDSWDHTRVYWYQKLSKSERIAMWIAMVIIAAKGWFMIHQRVIQYDEAWTYNLFTSKPFYIAFILTNNHPLFLHLSNLFDCIPLLDTLTSYRLPVYIIGLLLAISSFFIFHRLLYKEGAWLSWLVFVFGGVFTSFSLYGRGYILMLFFLVLAIYYVYRIILNASDLNAYILFILSSILGFYSVPSFILPYAILLLTYCVLLGSKDENNFKRWRYMITSVAVTGLVVFLLYLPMIFGLGLGSTLAQGGYSGSEDKFWDVLPRRAEWFGHFITNIPYYGWMVYVILLVVIIVFGIVQYRNRNKVSAIAPTNFLIVLIGLNLLFPLVLIYGFKNYYAERIWSYLAIYFSLGIGLIVGNIYNRLNDKYTKIKRPVLLLFYTIVTLWLAYHSYYNPYIRWNEDQEKVAKEISNQLIETKSENVYSYYAYYDVFLEYYFREQGKDINIVSGDTMSWRYKPLENIRQYDGIIIYSEMDDYQATIQRIGSDYHSLIQGAKGSLWVKN